VPTLRVLRANSILSTICALLLVASAGAVRAAEAVPDAPAITAAEIENAITKVKADPNLAQERKVRSLRWRDSGDATPKKRPGWLKWISEFFGFLAETSRVIVWLIIGVAIALLVIAIVKIVRSIGIGQHGRAAAFSAPTHVRDLDIRPESLPDDVGAAAFALWERGEHRAALALLYRGLLSRLVHAYEIPIRHSSTEGDCMMLAVERLAGERGDYVARVIRVWQRAVYGAQLPQTDDVRAMCAGFAGALSTPTPSVAA
jgi:hypothetical protein